MTRRCARRFHPAEEDPEGQVIDDLDHAPNHEGRAGRRSTPQGCGHSREARLLQGTHRPEGAEPPVVMEHIADLPQHTADDPPYR